MSTTKTLAPLSPITKSTREKHKEYLFPATLQYYAETIVPAEAKGMRIRDADGNEYLDFFGGILTVSVGHCNDRSTPPSRRRWIASRTCRRFIRPSGSSSSRSGSRG